MIPCRPPPISADARLKQHMSYLTACLIVILSTVAASGASNILRRRLQLEARRRHHDVGNPIFLQLGLLFAVLLAFVYSDVQFGYNAAAAFGHSTSDVVDHAKSLLSSLVDKREEYEVYIG